jgi:hypothetical protein
VTGGVNRLPRLCFSCVAQRLSYHVYGITEMDTITNMDTITDMNTIDNIYDTSSHFVPTEPLDVSSFNP